MNPLDKLLNMYYNQRECAEQLDIPQTTLSNWKNKGFIPYRHGASIEEKTGGKIKATDIYKYAGKCLKEKRAATA